MDDRWRDYVKYNGAMIPMQTHWLSGKTSESKDEGLSMKRLKNIKNCIQRLLRLKFRILWHSSRCSFDNSINRIFQIIKVWVLELPTSSCRGQSIT